MFYRPDIDYGSASVRGPVGIVMNRGLSNLFYGPEEREIFSLNWGDRFDNVGLVLRTPLQSIEDVGGWGEFIRREFLVPSRSIWEWSSTSNYAGHVVAGGLSYRYLREWMEYRGVPLSGVAAATLVLGANVVNEAIEWPRNVTGRANSMADMYVFEPLGVLLMSHDGIARFFTETLRAADWSPQVSLTLPSGRVQNVSQVMSYKVPLPWVGEWRGLVTLGLLAQVGITHPVGQEGLSLGATFGYNGRGRVVDPITGLERWETALASGLFLDRNNSLLASMIVSETGYERVQFNVFPGLLPGEIGRRLGLWATYREDDGWSIGIATRRTLGLGTGIDWVRQD